MILWRHIDLPSLHRKRGSGTVLFPLSQRQLWFGGPCKTAATSLSRASLSVAGETDKKALPWASWVYMLEPSCIALSKTDMNAENVFWFHLVSHSHNSRTGDFASCRTASLMLTNVSAHLGPAIEGFCIKWPVCFCFTWKVLSSVVVGMWF